MAKLYGCGSDMQIGGSLSFARTLHTSLALGLLAFASTCAFSQAVPTASRAGIAQLGAGWTVVKPDYGQKNVQGVSIYGTFDFLRHIGVEGSIHLASMVTPTDIGEDSYLLGPRYVFRYGRFNPYGKAMFGLARFKYKFQDVTNAYTYGVYAFGGGLDYAATKRINVRAIDFEYQKWPSFPTNGLTPLVFTFGAAYSFR